MDRIDTAAAESLAGQRQHTAEYELGRWSLAEARPVELCVHAVARCPMQVLGCGRERHLGPDRALSLGQGTHEPVEERRVGHDVRDRWAGRENPVLYPEERVMARTSLTNLVPAAILSSPLHRLLSSKRLVLTFTGRRSGTRYTTPVNYLQRGREVLITTDSK